MTRDFDKLISDAAPPVPDCGPARRTTRMLLHDRMRQQASRKQTRDVRGMAWAAGLVFLVMLGGQVTELGSDGFDVSTQIIELENVGKVIRDEAPFGGPSGSFVEGTSREFIDEYYQSIAAGEGTPVKLEGWKISGKTLWLMTYMRKIQGKLGPGGGSPRNLIGYESDASPEILTFMANGIEDFRDLVDQGQIARENFGIVRSNGLAFEVYSWTRSWPGFGEVSYYSGLPVEQ